MSWISDVKEELHELAAGKKELRKFGLTIGSIFFILSILGYFKSWGMTTTAGLTIVTGYLLLGYFLPTILQPFYKIWMGFAFALGWFISRLILVFLYFCIITPIGIAARIVGKKMINLEFRSGRSSYWQIKKKTDQTNYQKMF